MRTRTIIFIALSIIVIAASGFLGYQYYKNRQPSQAQPTTTQETNQETKQPTESSTNTEPQKYAVKVYFSKHPDSDDDPSKVFALNRSSTDVKVGTFAITEMIIGPTSAEQSEGYFTTVKIRSGDSNCNGQDFTLNIENTVATLKFCRQFDHLGSVADGQAESALKTTLMQFNSVKKVVILNRDNDCEFNLSGMNLCKE